MKVRNFRRQYQGLWRTLSRLAVFVLCLEVLLIVLIVQRAEAHVPVPNAAHAEKLAS